MVINASRNHHPPEIGLDQVICASGFLVSLGDDPTVAPQFRAELQNCLPAAATAARNCALCESSMPFR